MLEFQGSMQLYEMKAAVDAASVSVSLFQFLVLWVLHNETQRVRPCDSGVLYTEAWMFRLRIDNDPQTDQEILCYWRKRKHIIIVKEPRHLAERGSVLLSTHVHNLQLLQICFTKQASLAATPYTYILASFNLSHLILTPKIELHVVFSSDFPGVLLENATEYAMMIYMTFLISLEVMIIWISLSTLNNFYFLNSTDKYPNILVHVETLDPF